jgi:hypothetical protein
LFVSTAATARAVRAGAASLARGAPPDLEPRVVAAETSEGPDEIEAQEDDDGDDFGDAPETQPARPRVRPRGRRRNWG